MTIGGGFIVLCFALACLGSLSGLREAFSRPSATDPSSYELVYSVTGPGECGAIIEMEDSSSERIHARLPWRSATRTAHFAGGYSTAHAALRVYLPPSCPMEPEQLNCAVTRNGSPWGSEHGWIASANRAHSGAELSCQVQGDLFAASAPSSGYNITDLQRRNLAEQRAAAPTPAVESTLPPTMDPSPAEPRERHHRHHRH